MSKRHAYRIAIVVAALTVSATATGDIPQLPQSPTSVAPVSPMQRAILVDTSFKRCVVASPDRTITALDLTKIEGSQQAWQGSLASPVPANKSAPIFYGLGDPNCPRLWVTDFNVSPATTAKWPGGAAVPKFDPDYLIGDRARTGKYAAKNALTESLLLSNAETGGCDDAAHKYKGKSYDTTQKCRDAASKDICSRLLRRSVVAFKKDGTADLKVYQSGFGGFLWNGMRCEPSSGFSYEMVEKTYDLSKAAADALRVLPVPAGRKDVYRVAAGVFLHTKALTIQDGNAVDHGTSTGDASFLFNPKLYSPDANPIVEQVPVEAVLEPSAS